MEVRLLDPVHANVAGGVRPFLHKNITQRKTNDMQRQVNKQPQKNTVKIVMKLLLILNNEHKKYVTLRADNLPKMRKVVFA